MEYEEAKAYDEGYADGLAAGRMEAHQPPPTPSEDLADFIRSLGKPDPHALAYAIVNRYEVYG